MHSLLSISRAGPFFCDIGQGTEPVTGTRTISNLVSQLKRARGPSDSSRIFERRDEEEDVLENAVSRNVAPEVMRQFGHRDDEHEVEEWLQPRRVPQPWLWGD